MLKEVSKVVLEDTIEVLREKALYSTNIKVAGAGVRLASDSKEFIKAARENFHKGSSEEFTVLALTGQWGRKCEVLYSRDLPALVLNNCRSYGKVKSYILGLVGAKWESKGILSLHSSAVDIGGQAVVFLAGSGVGKTHLSLDFVRAVDDARLLSDDWNYLDVGTLKLVSGERNIYLRRFASRLFSEAVLVRTSEGRAVASVRKIVGKPSRKSSRLALAVLIRTGRRLSFEEVSSEWAVDYLVWERFFNPYLLHNSPEDIEYRRELLLRAFGRVRVFLLEKLPPKVDRGESNPRIIRHVLEVLES